MSKQFKFHDVKVLKKVTTLGAGDMGDGSKVYTEMLIGEDTHISINFTAVGKGRIIIGSGVTIAPNVTIYTSMPRLSKKGHNKYVTGHEPVSADVVIEDGVFIGTGCVIGCGVTIKKGTVLTPLTNVKPFTTYERTYQKWK